MTFVLRAAAGQPNFRPRAGPKAGHRVRATASTTGGPLSSGATPAAAVAGPAGGFPLWCLPALVLAAAMPMYGYKTQMAIINEARAKQRGATAGATKTASK
ncbi:hypothetical protein TSOC_014201 [Tetrabaena socialis]|uniref:Uncharacterized protein n=1 Tax=Tetrabaena socialis TaxID=47790 RepID=A0A2J7ZIC8_9CHLO|nr:hypothetical protein TSOC_014201 [Tetrabaena socialis]|eukprot:PNG99999.1 hypothetical protein TSOC_014201 [Tetrabaena socialis]